MNDGRKKSERQGKMVNKKAGGEWLEATKTKVVTRDKRMKQKKEGQGATEGKEGARRRRQRAWGAEREGHIRHKTHE